MNYYQKASIQLTKDLIKVTKCLIKDNHRKYAKIIMSLAENAFYSEFPKQNTKESKTCKNKRNQE